MDDVGRLSLNHDAAGMRDNELVTMSGGLGDVILDQPYVSG